MKFVVRIKFLSLLINNQQSTMKLKALLFVATLLFSMNVLAQGEIIIIPQNEGQGNDSGGYPKGPILIPTVYYEDYVLTFDSSCIGCTIELVQDDEVVFTGVVDTNGEVEIPETLVGLVELRIRRGGITFVGEFEIE